MSFMALMALRRPRPHTSAGTQYPKILDILDIWYLGYSGVPPLQ